MTKTAFKGGLPTAELVYGFTDQFLAKNFDDRQETPEFHKQLWKLFCDPFPQVAVAAPRGHAKSTACTHSFVLTCMLFRYRRYAVIVSDTVNQACEFLADIKRELEENEEVIKLFGVKGFGIDNKDTVVVRMQGAEDHDIYEFRISARGSEQKLRGMKWRNTRPDLIVCDDLENDELCENEERREKLRKWFQDTLLPIGSRRTVIRVVGTILHFDSILERLMPERLNRETPENLVVEPLCISSKEKLGNHDWISVKYRAHNDPEYTDILWPAMFDEERLKRIRQGYVNQGNPEGYAREYLNYPIASENAMFRKTDLIDFQEDTAGPWQYTMMGDLAISKKDRRAYTALGVVGINAEGVARLFRVERFRGDSLEILDKIFELDTDFGGVEMLLLEDENIAKTLMPVLSREMEHRNQYIVVEKVPTNRDKVARARALQARTRQKKVEFDHNSTWWPNFLQEMIQFPDGPYMDQVDMLSHFFLYLDQVNYAPTSEEIEEEEYEAQIAEFFEDDFGSGRSAWTGY